MGFLLETALRRTRYLLPDELPHWEMPPPNAASTAEITRMVDAIVNQSVPDVPNYKGNPDLLSIKRAMAGEIGTLLASGTPQDAWREARRLASIDMSDGLTFSLCLELACLINQEALAAARLSLKSNLVMHVSCMERIARAMASCRSFEPAEENVSQIIVIGSMKHQGFDFDPDGRVLTVPASDAYEHLPSKVMAAMFFLSLCGNVTGVLKVDDDHRLESRHELMRGFSRMQYSLPLQLGQLIRIRALGLNARAWHFGKSSNAELDRTCFTYPGTTRWASGASGYFINGKALHLLLWSYVYFQDYIDSGLYEDMVVSDLIDRQGGRLAGMDMGRVLSTVEAY
jgi:hypothetical protein